MNNTLTTSLSALLKEVRQNLHQVQPSANHKAETENVKICIGDIYADAADARNAMHMRMKP